MLVERVEGDADDREQAPVLAAFGFRAGEGVGGVVRLADVLSLIPL